MKRTRLARTTARNSLLVSVVLITVLACAGAAWSLKHSHDQLAATAAISTQNMSDSLLHQIGEEYAKADAVLLALSDEFDRQQRSGKADPKALQVLVTRLQQRNPQLAMVGVVDASGQLVLGQTNQAAPARKDVGDHPYFLKLRDKNASGLIVSPPVQGRVAGQWGLFFVRKLQRADGGFAGGVVAKLSLSSLEQHLSTQQISANDSIALRDAKLGLILRLARHKTTMHLGEVRTSADFQAALERDPHKGNYTSGASSIDGVQRVHSYRLHPTYAFYVNVGKSRDDYLAVWREELATTAAIGLALGLALLLGTALLLRNWRRLEQGAIELAQSAERFRTLVEASPVPMAEHDEAGRILLLNAAFTRVFGFRQSELASLADWMHQVESSSFDADGTRPVEAVVRCKDGSTITVLTESTVLHASNRHSHLVVFYDITERKLSEQRLAQSNAELEDKVIERSQALSAAMERMRQCEQRFQVAQEPGKDAMT